MITADFAQRFRRTFLLACAWAVLTFLIGPMLVVIPVSLTDRRYLSLPEKALSLQHYRSLLSSDVWWSAAGQSLLIASVSTLLAVVLGSLCAVACWRLANRLAGAVVLLMLLPLIVPTVVQGLAMYRVWAAIGLFDTIPGVILAHALTGIPYVVITVSAALAGFDVKLEQAARSLGASMTDTLRLVILPAILPGVLSGALFAFVHSFDELVIVLFIASRGVQTLPKRIWDGIQDDIDPAIAAVAVIMMLLTVGTLVVHLAVRAAHERRRRRLAAREAAADLPSLTAAGAA